MKVKANLWKPDSSRLNKKLKLRLWSQVGEIKYKLSEISWWWGFGQSSFKHDLSVWPPPPDSNTVSCSHQSYITNSLTEKCGNIGSTSQSFKFQNFVSTFDTAALLSNLFHHFWIFFFFQHSPISLPTIGGKDAIVAHISGKFRETPWWKTKSHAVIVWQPAKGGYNRKKWKTCRILPPIHIQIILPGGDIRFRQGSICLVSIFFHMPC